MANENTQRRGIYLPKALDDWFVAESKRTGKRINALMLESLESFKNRKKKKVDPALKKEVVGIIEEYLNEHGGC